MAENIDELKEAIKEKAKHCYQCGVCMGGCPVARVNEEFNPRRLMYQLINDQWTEVLEGKDIWLCAQCHLCTESCLQDVGISDLIIDLRNLAVKIGVSPPEHYLSNLKMVSETGRLAKDTSRVQRLREKLELGNLSTVALDEIRVLIEGTKFQELLEES
jgi:heterodisulfide reductase subunit C